MGSKQGDIIVKGNELKCNIAHSSIMRDTEAGGCSSETVHNILNTGKGDGDNLTKGR